MKHIMNTIKTISVGLALVFAATSCEDFFDRAPKDEFSTATFFASETDLQLYANGLIEAAMPSVSNLTLGEDAYTDFCGTKQSKAIYTTVYTASTASGWAYSNWSFLRRCVYMLDNMHNAKGKVSDEIYNHYEGVARYWRAYATFNKVKDFGNTYWIDTTIQPEDSLKLYGPRDDREYVMHMVAEDLKFAVDNCLTDGAGINSNGRIYINKYVVLAFASRLCLYEGTYRKYHSTNPSTGKPWTNEYETSEDFLELARDYAKQLIDTDVFSLHNNYRELFVSTALPTDEVIWGRSFNEEYRHNLTYTFYSATAGQQYSPTKDFVHMFLETDGTPVASAEVSVTEEFNNRDARLAACVLAPGQTYTTTTGATADFAPNFTWTRTGYQWIKWSLTDEIAWSVSNDMSDNAIPIFRYAEVLLNYAEAVAELGQMTSAIWDDTIGELRRRAGVTSIYPEDGAYVPDQWLRDYYTQDVEHPAALSDIILEIRRERATELFMENDTRYNDLMRWCMGDLIERRYNHQGWAGIWVTEEEAEQGFTFNGKHYLVGTNGSSNDTGYKIVSSTSDRNFSFSEGDHGYVIYNYQMNWEDKMYTKPIPVTALNVNPDILQNDGWQWN